MRYILCFVLFTALTTALPGAVALGSSQNAHPSDMENSSLTPVTANADCPRPLDLFSTFHRVVADSEALVEKGDLTAARGRIASLDLSLDGRRAPFARAVGHWRIFHRAIDRGLDRALLALRPLHPDPNMSRTALRDLLAAIEQAQAVHQGNVGRACL